MSYTHDPVARDLPSLLSLQAFEASARHRSFTRAAAELNVTQGAVSRQVQALESHLGLALFHRIRKRISLTSAGEAYVSRVRACLDRLEAATIETRAFKGAGGVLNLAILPTFGTKWLIPHFPTFSARHPEILVNFSTRIHAFDFAEEELDAAIHFGDTNWPGTRMDYLMDEEVVAVCSPAVKRKGLRKPADLAAQTLLQIASRPRAWEEWLGALGLHGIDGRRGPRFEHHAMVIQAAIASLGVAVLPRFLVDEELLDRRLVMPFPAAVRSQKAYYLVYPEDRRDLPALQAFRGWLLEELRLARPTRT